MTKVAFRVDGSSKIGMGHMMRCLALAQVFPDDINISFITKDTRSAKKSLKNYEFEIMFIDNELSFDSEEIKEISEIVKSNDIDILITDSYNISQQYLVEMKKVVNKLITIHDFAPYAFPSDIVINGNIYAPELNYKSLNGDTEFLLGTNYILLRKEFQNLSTIEIKEKVKKILVTVGGSDLLNLTPKIIRSINKIEETNKLYTLDIDNIIINVIIGPGFTNITEIVEEVRRSNLQIKLHFNTSRMSKLMLESDLAISAGGSTLYELAVTGTPTIVMLQAQNQELVAETMEKENIIINLGYGDKTSVHQIKDNIENLMVNFNKRKQMFENAKKINNNGAYNCVKHILNLNLATKNV